MITVHRAPVLVAAAILFTHCGAASAQWLKLKTPGIPRTADGKPDLSAPAPRTADGKPDLSGLWRLDPVATPEIRKATKEPKAQPWPEALAKKRLDDFARDAPYCMPPGPTADFVEAERIIQSPGVIALLSDLVSYRQIFLDGRALPEIVNPDWMGYSVGHWDGDTLVVETAGFNDKTWLGAGYPHTEALRLTERFRRTDFGHMEVQKTFVDPGALVEPWTVHSKLEFFADTEMLETVFCENERDRQHFVGKASDLKGITVAPEILSKYVGSYELKFPDVPPINAEVKLVDGQLTMSGMGLRPIEMKAVSETEFSGVFGVVRFEKDEQGKVTDMILSAVEGDFKAPRK